MIYIMIVEVNIIDGVDFFFYVVDWYGGGDFIL